MVQKLTDTELERLRNSFRRCSHETVEAIIKFREERDASLISKIAYGIIERYIPAEANKGVSQMSDATRLIEDLGIDSLTMLEVVLSIEEALVVRIENDELYQIRTLGDVKTFIQQKVTAAVNGQSSSTKKTAKLTREHLALLLPHQHPFLFLDSAELDGNTIRAQYHIRGDEFFLEGHFKDNPIFPASIVFEAMGQAACALILNNTQEQEGKTLDVNSVLFGSMESAHFYRKARPGDLLDFEVELVRVHEPLAVFNCKASVGGEKLAKVDELVIVFGEAAQVFDQPKKQAEVVEAALPAL